MIEKIQDAFNSIKDRFQNSFIITFIVVWSVIHWRLVYSLLNFDSYEDRLSKVAFVEKYINEHSMIWEPLCHSILSLIILYALFIFSDIIHDGYNLVRNNILLLIRSKKVVRIEEYNKIGRELDRVRSRAGEFQRKETEYILSKEDLEKEVIELSRVNEQTQGQLEANAEKLKELNNLTEELTVSRSSIARLQGDLSDKTNTLNNAIEASKEKDHLILNEQLKSTKLQFDNEIKSTFQVWADSEVPQLSENWLNLTDREKERFTETYYRYKEFKELFGLDSWVINSNNKQFRLNKLTITLTKDVRPTFITKEKIVFNVKKIVFIDKENFQFVVGVSNAGNDYIINLKVKSENKYEGLSDGNEIEFNRIVTTKEL